MPLIKTGVHLLIVERDKKRADKYAAKFLAEGAASVLVAHERPQALAMLSGSPQITEVCLHSQMCDHAEALDLLSRRHLTRKSA